MIQTWQDVKKKPAKIHMQGKLIGKKFFVSKKYKFFKEDFSIEMNSS